MTMLRRVLACGGLSTKVTSVCQRFARLSSLSTGRTFGSPSTAGTVGCAALRGPKWRANRCWPSSSTSMPRKTSALCSLSGARIAVTVPGSSSREGLTPVTSAPIRAVILRRPSFVPIDVVVMMRPLSAGRVEGAAHRHWVREQVEDRTVRIHGRRQLLIALGAFRSGHGDVHPDRGEARPHRVVKSEEPADVEIAFQPHGE